MPSIISNTPSTIYTELEDQMKKSIKLEKSPKIQPPTPQKRRLRSNSSLEDPNSPITSPPKHLSPPVWKSPRRCMSSSPNGHLIGNRSGSDIKVVKSPRKRLVVDSLSEKPKWNPKDREQISMVKEALHVSTAPSAVVCREEERNKVLDFCKSCIEEEKGGSLYLCGCPGTGKTLSMEKVKQKLLEWVEEVRFEPPNVLPINCTSLANTSEVFSKILEMYLPCKKVTGASSALQHLRKLFSQNKHSPEKQSSRGKMMLIIADELDYLITKDQSVLHDLFMLTTFPFSTCILIGIANAIDLADRFLPKLQALNCKPIVITFRAYSKDQILRILQQRLMALPYNVFHPQALELCARKVAAVSGDMRKALCVCRSAIEMLEADLRDTVKETDSLQLVNASHGQFTAPASECLPKQETEIVRIDHMALALSRAFKSAIVDTLQSLPQHQQIIICAMVKLFRTNKKDTTVGQLNKSYTEMCKSTLVPPATFLEFSNMCRVLSDQGLFKIGQSREDRLKRVTLKVDEADITFALQGIRFFRSCLQ